MMHRQMDADKKTEGKGEDGEIDKEGEKRCRDKRDRQINRWRGGRDAQTGEEWQE